MDVDMTMTAAFEQGFNVGVDVGRERLDVFWHENSEHQSVENGPAGIRVLIRRLRKENIQRIVVEATGCHEKAFVLAAASAGLPVIIVRPLIIRRYAEVLGVRAKNGSYGCLPDCAVCGCHKARLAPAADKGVLASQGITVTQTPVAGHEKYGAEPEENTSGRHGGILSEYYSGPGK